MKKFAIFVSTIALVIIVIPASIAYAVQPTTNCSYESMSANWPQQAAEKETENFSMIVTVTRIGQNTVVLHVFDDTASEADVHGVAWLKNGNTIYEDVKTGDCGVRACAQGGNWASNYKGSRGFFWLDSCEKRHGFYYGTQS